MSIPVGIQDKANPTALLLSSVMMLRHLEMNSHAGKHTESITNIAFEAYCGTNFGDRNEPQTSAKLGKIPERLET